MNKKNVPEIRFSGFDGEWKEYKLNDVAFYENGKAHEKYIANLGKFKVVNSKFVSTDGNVYKYTKKQIKPLFIGDIAMVLSDVPAGKALAKTFFVKENDKYSLNQRVSLIRTKENNHNYFLNKVINRNPYFLSFDDGVNQTNLSINDVLYFSFNTPTFKEQEKIGTLFENLDELIVNTEKKYNYLKNIKDTLLSKMLPANYSNAPDIRFKGFYTNWQNSLLKNIINIERGASPRPIDKFLTKSFGGYNWIKISDAPSDGIYIDKTSEKIIKEGLSRTRIVNKGDLILSNSMSYGRPYIVNLTGCIHDGWLLIKDYNRNLNTLFFCYFLGSENMLNKYKSLAAGSTVNNLNKDLVLNCNIDYPDLPEQTKIGELFKSLDELITLTKKKHEKLKNIKNALLAKMFC